MLFLACGGKLEHLDGVLQFPLEPSEQYNHALSCAWVIQTNSTKVLNITFTRFDLEDSAECQFDWVQIHDGRNSAAHNIGRFCGSQLPKGGNIITTTNSVYIWFRSDTRLAKHGFSLNWTTIDPGLLFSLILLFEKYQFCCSLWWEDFRLVLRDDPISWISWKLSVK